MILIFQRHLRLFGSVIMDPMILFFQRHLRLFGSVIMDPITPLPEKPNLLSEKSKIENYELRITNYELQITNYELRMKKIVLFAMMALAFGACQKEAVQRFLRAYYK